MSNKFFPMTFNNKIDDFLFLLNEIGKILIYIEKLFFSDFESLFS
jgi:hypothetical protein